MISKKAGEWERDMKRRVISVSGKGGAGKTMISALLIREILAECDRSGVGCCVLAIDADPDANLADALGVSYEKTVGDIREKILEEKQREIGMDIRIRFEAKIAEIMVEEHGFDLIVMGRPEGPGCYCPVNHILRAAIDALSRNYDFTVIDCEAGLEHLSRRTTQDVDVMIVVIDETMKSIRTALRLIEIARELDVDVGNMFFVANKITTEETKKRIEAAARRHGIEISAFIPYDQSVARFDIEGIPVVNLPDDSPSVVAVRGIVKMVMSDDS